MGLTFLTKSCNSSSDWDQYKHKDLALSSCTDTSSKHERNHNSKCVFVSEPDLLVNEQMEDGNENDPDEDKPSEASINMFLYVLKP